jgi:hypothetical protein
VLESVDGIRTYIPNTSMLGEMVHVYTATDARRAQFDMSLPAGTDIAKALGIISKTLTTSDGVRPDPAPEVLATCLDQDAMIVTARFWYTSKLKTDIARSPLQRSPSETPSTPLASDSAEQPQDSTSATNPTVPATPHPPPSPNLSHPPDPPMTAHIGE